MNAPAPSTLAVNIHPMLRHFSKLLVVATLLLLFLGGQVKSNDAGLAVPDWPLTYGENPITYPVSKWTGGIFHEHFHRLIAGIIALMTVVLAGLLQWREKRRWVKVLGWLSVFAVLLQALLGGLTVLYQLPDAVSSAHGLLAQSFFVLTIIIAYALSKEWQRRNHTVHSEGGENHSPVFKATLLLIVFIYGQLLLGALTRHTDSALAIPDFPTTGNQVVPSFDDEMLTWINDWRFDHTLETGVDLPDVEMWQVKLHFAHRVGAVIVTLFTLFLAWLAARNDDRRPELVLVAYSLCGLVGIQFFLGMMTVLTAEAALVASLHLMTGALFLGVTVYLALRAWTMTPNVEIVQVPHAS